MERAIEITLFGLALAGSLAAGVASGGYTTLTLVVWALVGAGAVAGMVAVDDWFIRVCAGVSSLLAALVLAPLGGLVMLPLVVVMVLLPLLAGPMPAAADEPVTAPVRVP